MCEFCEKTNFKIVDGYEKGKKHAERTKSIFAQEIMNLTKLTEQY